ncbi:hypothetical protein HALA3H3_890101 [Halomonas sp. A3H3]|nr:conserved hypothetical protein [Halomonas sp. 156]CAD5289371.1 conserved hypothetical protein [Halomonas sp. 113]CAD5290816.1 conserved hypothetical protein [Halomonas sp. 59]CAD5294697.1 conserved hypothetical protein [Halomonas sp. I3]CDG55396.1 hypothetical protein HALA3H3_890101 [Halomonas sp. A3H3]VXB49470.1 conserved hypothetical protein [Halomonas titanicae]
MGYAHKNDCHILFVFILLAAPVSIESSRLLTQSRLECGQSQSSGFFLSLEQLYIDKPEHLKATQAA